MTLNSNKVCGLGRVIPCIVTGLLIATAQGANPVPLATSLLPTTLEPGTFNVMSVYGSGIVPGQTQVRWGGAPLLDATSTVCYPPTPTWPGYCLFIVTPTETASPHTAEVSLWNPGAGPSTPLLLPITRPAVGVATMSLSIPSAPHPPLVVATADFNSDGIIDLAVASACAAAPGDPALSCVDIWLGNGTGGFKQASSTWQAAINIKSMVTADFNHDGKLDLAATLDSTVLVMLGDGKGGFSSSTHLPYTTTHLLFAITVGDFNRDGNPDLVALDSQYSRVYLGNGHGGFSPLPLMGTNSYAQQSIATADFNSDGILDLAILDYLPGEVDILLGDGTGKFTFEKSVLVAQSPAALVVADFNNDGHPDLAVSTYFTATDQKFAYGSGEVRVLLGDGVGGFTPLPTMSGSSGFGDLLSIAAADLNGDGTTDLALTSLGDTSAEIVVLTGDGRGGFPGETWLACECGNSLALGDFNGDGRIDFITANPSSGSFSVLLQTQMQSLSPSSLVFPATSIGSASAAQTVGITNTGSATLQVTGSSLTGPFQTVAGGSCPTSTPFSLLPGANCTINVDFAPKASGAASGQLSFTSSDPNFGNTTVITALGGTGR